MAGHEGHRKRLKEEFLARPSSFPDHKVLELLLFYVQPRQDTNPLAHELIDRFGSLVGVMDATGDELQKVSGIGGHAVTLIKCTKELSGRYLNGRTEMESIARSTQDYYGILHHHFFGARVELSYLLCMDGKRKVLGVRKLGEGNMNAVAVSARLVVEAALSLNAAMVVLAHNHVSGVALPSDEDVAVTHQFSALLHQVGVRLDDHLIFVDDDMVSMRDSGHYGQEY